jgi:hypothetical protein
VEDALGAGVMRGKGTSCPEAPSSIENSSTPPRGISVSGRGATGLPDHMVLIVSTTAGREAVGKLGARETSRVRSVDGDRAPEVYATAAPTLRDTSS